MSEQLALIPDLAPAAPPVPPRLADMHAMYGRCEGRHCGECGHFVRFRQGRGWAKCKLTTMTHSAATDWRARWQSCGRFEQQGKEGINE